jgi:hypothetical protein
MRARASMFILGVGMLVAAVPLAAHHSFAAEYDSTKPITLRGKVTKVEWVNPHGWIHLDVKGPDGKVVNWGIETGSPNALYRRGWKKDSLAIGTEIVCDGYRAKDGTPTVNGTDVTFPDGRKVYAGSSGDGAAPGRSRDQ